MKLFTRKPVIYELFKEIRAEQDAIERRAFYKMAAKNMKLEAFSEYRELPAPSGKALSLYFYTMNYADDGYVMQFDSPANGDVSKAN